MHGQLLAGLQTGRHRPTAGCTYVGWSTSIYVIKVHRRVTNASVHTLNIYKESESSLLMPVSGGHVYITQSDVLPLSQQPVRNSPSDTEYHINLSRNGVTYALVSRSVIRCPGARSGVSISKNDGPASRALPLMDPPDKGFRILPDQLRIAVVPGLEGEYHHEVCCSRMVAACKPVT